jgi:hypothetical protein
MIEELILSVVTGSGWVVAGVFWYRLRTEERSLNRRLVAYEGKLRSMGHEPDRVYHDFENMLSGNPEDRQAEEFDVETRRKK